jgi:hypothetical protein
MKALETFIDNNFHEFSNLSDSEVIHLSLPTTELSNEVIDYLKSIERFDYKNICIYYVKRDNEIWIENFGMY